MSDFSNKYKSAVDRMKISPDFKEQTARKMTELRDSENSSKRSKIKLYKGLSVAAAAAACIAAVFSLGRAGIFDKNSAPSVIAAPEATDTIEYQTSEAAPTAADEALTDMTSAAEHGYEENYALADEANVTSAVSTVGEAETEYEPAENENVADEAAVTSVVSLADEETAEEEIAVSDSASAENESEYEYEEAFGQDEAEIAMNEEAEETLPLQAAEYMPPLSDASSDTSAYNEEAADDGEGTDDSGIEEAIVSDFAKADGFSAREAVSTFKAASSSAEIIPTVSGYDEDGGVVSYSSKKISSIKGLNSLEKELYTYTEDREAASLTTAPSDSSYIVDFTDDEGNSLRIYIGSSYICFSLTDGSLFSYKISADEYADIDSLIMSLIA